MSKDLKKTRGSPVKNQQPLNQEQQALVETHLWVARRVVLNSIHVNETIYGFGYEDLYQEGCILLCKAAVSYDKEVASFTAYAKKVVRNGLISYCRIMCGHQKHFQYLETGEQGELMVNGEVLLGQTDQIAEHIKEMELLELLERCKEYYAGITLLGIEAIAWKLRGLELKDIADIYQVPSTHVGAWISRAAAKLRNSKQFLQGIS